MTSTKLLIVVLIGLVVGAITGLALKGILGNFYLRWWPVFLATVIGCVIRNTVMVRGSGAPDDARIPMVVIVFSIVASLAGSSAALEIAQHSHDQMSCSVWIGALAGLFASILMAMLTIVYHLNPSEHSPEKR
jgi:uncharacterized membrane protein YbjE (DUF340 family)